jgi:hypothetical protein
MYMRLADHGHAFSTRPRGAALLAEFEAQAASSSEVVIDFEDVLTISYSFTDEFVGALLERAAQKTYTFDVRLEHVPDQFRPVILKSLAARGLAVDPAELFDLAVS